VLSQNLPNLQAYVKLVKSHELNRILMGEQLCRLDKKHLVYKMVLFFLDYLALHLAFVLSVARGKPSVVQEKSTFRCWADSEKLHGFVFILYTAMA